MVYAWGDGTCGAGVVVWLGLAVGLGLAVRLLVRLGLEWCAREAGVVVRVGLGWWWGWG
jgi:hypothetical protein